jgi:hypothetical protein
VRWTLVLLFVALAGCSAPPFGAELASSDFDSDALGQRPAGFFVVGGEWVVATYADPVSRPHVLYQTSDRNTHAHAVVQTVLTPDVAVEVQVRIISGIFEREAGIVLRWSDSGDHYVFNIDANEGGARFTRVADGLRDDLFLDRNLKYDVNRWYDLRIEAQGDTFRGFVDGEQVLLVRDATHAGGQAGVYTKLDTIARFDDFEVFG